MRYVLLLLTLLAPLSAGARDTIVVYDATAGDYWPLRPIVAEYVDAGVPLVIRHGKHESCQELRRRPPQNADIIVCERERPSVYGSGGGTLFGRPTFVYLIRASDDYIARGIGAERNTVCHELMHALTHIPDNDAGRADSCVWGELDHLGDFDIRYLHHHLAKF
jgi:hypothetical protein